MQVSEVQKYIGRKGKIYSNGLTILVKIKDIKERWGQTRYLVTPLSGTGEIWVENIRIEEETKKEKSRGTRRKI